MAIARMAPPETVGGRLADGVYGSLRRSILHGEYRPSERLVETDIAERLGASRTPTREALQRLAAEGLALRGRNGWVVREFTLAEIREIYQVRAALEGYAARTAAGRIGAAAGPRTAAGATRSAAAGSDRGAGAAADGDAGADARALQRLADEHRKLLDRTPIPRPDVVDINDRFHDALVAAAGNRRLADLVGQNRTYYFNFRLAARYTEEQTARALADHLAVTDAVLSRNGARADRLARRHVDFAMTLIQQYGDYRR